MLAIKSGSFSTRILFICYRRELHMHGRCLTPATTCFSRLTISDGIGQLLMVRCKILFYSTYFLPNILNMEFTKLHENLVL